MFRKPTVTSFCIGRRLNILLLILMVVLVNTLLVSRDLSTLTMRALTPPPPLYHQLDHLMRTRKLDDYVDDLVDPLVDPSEACIDDEIPLVALVTSAPHRVLQRDTIRGTWGKEIPTYFFLGLPSDQVDEQLVEYYIEAKQHRDMVVCDFVDGYHNLTLKTACMLQWAARRCAHAGFVLKTDDDVLVNPWRMTHVLQDNRDALLLGYMRNGTKPHRDAYVKWYLPRWLYPEEDIPHYLTGSAYLISGNQLERLYRAAFSVPLINLEDVYFTYLVANKTLGISLTHDSRVSPYQPIIAMDCSYWSLATIHSLTPDNILKIWPKVKNIARMYELKDEVCNDFVLHKYLSIETLLY